MKTTKLYQYQTEDVRRIRDLDGRCLLANEVGTGKTLTSLYYAWKFLPADPPGPIVCVVPSHLKLNWKREAQNHLGIRVEVLSGQRVPEDKHPPLDPNQVYVVNYDVLVPPHWKTGHPLPKNSWARFLKNLKPRLLIMDEAHFCKHRTAARTRACKSLAKTVPHVLALTGTPLTNSPRDLWSLLNILRPEMFPSETEFCMDYTNARKRFFGWEFKGARNLDYLHKVLREQVMIRRRKCDVMSDLPPVTHSVIPVEVDLREYAEAERDFLGWLDTVSPKLAARAAQAEQLTRLTYLKQLAAKLKIRHVVDWTENFLEDSDGKVLLGIVHHSVSRPLMEAFGRRAVLVNGEMDHETKDAAFYKFNRDPKCRVLVGNLQSAGTGWSCVSSSDVTAVEFPWTPADLEQFVGRVHGVGRGLPGVPATARYLMAVGTVEEDICRALNAKQRWAATAIDDAGGDVPLDVLTAALRGVRARAGG